MNTTQATSTTQAPLDGIAGQAAGEAVSQAPSVAAGAGDPLSGAVSTLGQTDPLFTWGSYFQTLALLFLIIAVLFAVLWYLKRRGTFDLLTRQGSLSLESRMTLGPKKSLVVVRFLNKRMLLGVTDQQITMLTELPADDDAPEHTASGPGNPAIFKAHIAAAARNGADDRA